MFPTHLQVLLAIKKFSLIGFMEQENWSLLDRAKLRKRYHSQYGSYVAFKKGTRLKTDIWKHMQNREHKNFAHLFFLTRKIPHLTPKMTYWVSLNQWSRTILTWHNRNIWNLLNGRRLLFWVDFGSFVKLLLHYRVIIPTKMLTLIIKRLYTQILFFLCILESGVELYWNMRSLLCNRQACILFPFQ